MRLRARRIMVGDYVQVLEKYMEDRGSRDLKSLLLPMEETMLWKTVPKLAMLLTFVDFYALLFEQAPNTVCLHTQLVAAILFCHGERPCIFGSGHTDLSAGLISNVIRMGAAKWRALKQDQRCRDVVFSQASPSQATVIAKLLDVISLDKSDFPPVPDSWETPDKKCKPATGEPVDSQSSESSTPKPCSDVPVGSSDQLAQDSQSSDVTVDSSAQLVQDLQFSDVPAGQLEPRNSGWLQLSPLSIFHHSAANVCC